eukprot:TRINITY_DN2930_c1_g1_i2.p3 TRINITY_DN2930_c1_g1~~TRINITY_DN2930_c1_g1_i2.p3  ORF type:complete len:121 (-),score=1.27 TRINITY_DN2930_c1_g1_i2:183-518(-)
MAKTVSRQEAVQKISTHFLNKPSKTNPSRQLTSKYTTFSPFNPTSPNQPHFNKSKVLVIRWYSTSNQVHVSSSFVSQQPSFSILISFNQSCILQLLQNMSNQSTGSFSIMF